MKKKFAIVFLSLLLVVSLPFAAHANIVTATGRYLINAVKHAPGGAKVEATNTATAAKHVINHGVSSADLGKSIGAGIVGFGLATGAGFAFKALTGLALDAVDWVMDPANNQVKWKEKGDVDVGEGSTSCAANSLLGPDKKTISQVIAEKRLAYKAPGVYGKDLESTRITCVDNTVTILYKTKWCEVACEPSIKYPYGQQNMQETVNYSVTGTNPNSGGSGSPDGYKSLPLVDLAKKVIELADSGNAAAQKDVEDHVTHRAQNGDLDNELDNSSDITPSEEPENPEEPNPEEPQECPSGSVKVDDVCVKIPDSDGDEPLFCDSSEFTKKVCDWIDWTQTEHDEPEPDSGKVDIKDKSEDLSIDNDRIDFSNQCPAPTPINTSVVGFPVSTELNYQPLCDFFTMLNPFVVGMGGISSALIIAGGARRG